MGKTLKFTTYDAARRFSCVYNLRFSNYDIFTGSAPHMETFDLYVEDETLADNILAGDWSSEYSTIMSDMKAAQARSERDALLSRTDWRFRTDMTPSQAWIDYCQALRDIPQQAGFPESIVWPQEPVE